MKMWTGSRAQRSACPHFPCDYRVLYGEKALREAGNTPSSDAARPGRAGALARADIGTAFALALFCLVLRLAGASTLNLSADEGVVGIMALDLLSGKAPTVYWYGQEYMGTLENIVAAPFIALFGTRPLSVRLPSVLSGALAVFIVYLCFARRRERAAGLAACLLLAAAPVFFHDATARARGGYGITLPMTAGMLAAVGGGRFGFARAFLFGLLCGAAFWTNPQTAEISLPLAVWALSARRSGRAAAGIAAGGILGLLPPLADWAATGTFMRLSGIGVGVSGAGLPVLLRRTAAFMGAGPGAPFVVAAVTAGLNTAFLAGGALLYIVRRVREGGARPLDSLLATPFLAMAVLAATPGAYPPSRYFYLAYFSAALVAAVGWLGPRAPRATGRWDLKGAFAVAAVAGVVAANGFGLLLYHAGDPFGDEYLSGEEYDAIERLLGARGVSRVVTDYGADYALMYLTGMDLKALPVPLGGVWSTRYAAALEAVPQSPDFAVVLYEQPAHERLKSHTRPDVFEEWLTETNRSAEVHVLGRTSVYLDISGLETAAGMEDYGMWVLERHPELHQLLPAVQRRSLLKRRRGAFPPDTPLSEGVAGR